MLFFEKLDRNCTKVTDHFSTQFGSFRCKLTQNNMKQGVATVVTLPTMMIFKGVNLCKGEIVELGNLGECRGANSVCVNT